jgi:oxalate decarboxylase
MTAVARGGEAIVTLKPGILRELHWHPNEDEWQYYV